MANFLHDNFTEASDTALESHTPDVAGGQWPSDWHNTRFDIVAADDLLSCDNTAVSYAISEPTPGDADYWCMVLAKTGSALSNREAGPGVRLIGGATNDGYFIYNAGNDERYLSRVVSGSRSLIDSDLPWNPVETTFYYMKLQVEGVGATITLKMWYKGTSEPGDTPDDTYEDTDAARLTATGKAGLMMRRLEPRIDWIQADVVAAGTTVSCTLGTVAIAGLNATVINDTDISASLGTVSISGLNATVTNNTDILCTLGQVAVSGLAASVTNETFISVTSGAVSVQGYQVTINEAADIPCTLGSLTIAGLNATVQAGQEAQCTLGQVTVDGYQTTINSEIQISCTLGQVTVASFNASITVGAKIQASLGTVTIAGLNASVSTGILIEPTTGLLVIAGYLADVFVGFPEVETPAARVLIIKNESRTLIVENEDRTLIIKQ